MKHIVIVPEPTIPRRSQTPGHQSCDAFCASCGWRGSLSSRPERMIDFAGWMHYEDTGAGSLVLDERDPKAVQFGHRHSWDPSTLDSICDMAYTPLHSKIEWTGNVIPDDPYHTNPGW